MTQALSHPDRSPPKCEDEAAIIASINAETQSFNDEDFDAWSDCWVEDTRAHAVQVSAFTGLSVLRGWQSISSDMKQVLGNGFGCGMTKFRQDNFQITINQKSAWAVFDQWAEDRDGYNFKTFETRLLEKTDGAWKIIFASFVELQNDQFTTDALSVDEKGQVIWASAQTLERLKAHPFLTISAGRVRAHRLDWDQALQHAIRHAATHHGFFEHRRFAQDTGGVFEYPAVLGETDAGDVAIVHVSVRDRTTYLAFDGSKSLERRLAVAQAVFALSDGQLRVARYIADGVNLSAAAASLGISVNTARTHLARLYEKTGVNSQTALVRLLLSVG